MSLQTSIFIALILAIFCMTEVTINGKIVKSDWLKTGGIKVHHAPTSTTR